MQQQLPLPTKPHHVISAGSQAIIDTGIYAINASISGSQNLVGLAALNVTTDEQEFWLVGVMPDAVLARITVNGNDYFYNPSVTGQYGPNNEAGTGIAVQTNVDMSIGKGDVWHIFRGAGRIWSVMRTNFGQIKRRKYEMLAATATYLVKLYDSVVRFNTTTSAQTVTLPPVADAFRDDCGLVLTFIVGTFGTGFNGVINDSTGALVYTLTAVGKSVTLYCNGTTWDVIAVV